MAQPHEKGRLAAFMGRPRHRLFMVFDSAEAADEALQWLDQEGHRGKGVWVLRGEEGMRFLDATGRREGLRGRVVRTVEHALSSDISYLSVLQEALEAGATVVVVAVPGAEAADRLGTSLEARGARDLAYFADWEFQPVLARRA